MFRGNPKVAGPGAFHLEVPQRVIARQSHSLQASDSTQKHQSASRCRYPRTYNNTRPIESRMTIANIKSPWRLVNFSTAFFLPLPGERAFMEVGNERSHKSRRQ